MEKELVIIGAGPAGLTAAIYACRARIDVLVLEKMASGGLMLSTETIENYPGFPEGVEGFALSSLFEQQARNFGMELKNDEVKKITVAEDGRILLVTEDGEITAKTVIYAAGASPRKLDIPGERELAGRGVSYCATCDGAFFREKELFVIGGGDSAVEEAIFLTRFASKVYITHRRDQLRATKLLAERAVANPKIEFIWDSVPLSISGENKVTQITLKNVKSGEVRTLPADGVFIYIGLVPNSGLIKDLVDCDEQGFIVTDSNMRCGVPGIYAAGDIRCKELRQIINAAADGAEAAFAVQKYLEE